MDLDLSFCARKCANMECPRNVKHLNTVNIEEYHYLSYAYFDNCDIYKSETEEEQVDETKLHLN